MKSYYFKFRSNNEQAVKDFFHKLQYPSNDFFGILIPVNGDVFYGRAAVTNLKVIDVLEEKLLTEEIAFEEFNNTVKDYITKGAYETCGCIVFLNYY